MSARVYAKCPKCASEALGMRETRYDPLADRLVCLDCGHVWLQLWDGNRGPRLNLRARSKA